MPKKLCPHCGAAMVEYKHTFSLSLATGLRKLYEASGVDAINIKLLDLTRNQWDNFQKLRYWGLVTKSVRENGFHIAGTWEITPKGISFLIGEIGLPRNVITYRGNALRFEGSNCHIDDYHPDKYKQRPEYAEEARPHMG